MSKLTLGIVSDWINGKGIMSVLTNNFDVPWADSIDGQTLDDDYYGNRSGNKIIAPLVQKFVNEDGITDDKMLRLARVIYAKYGEGWNRAFLALSEEYNPLHNYDGTETYSETENVEGTNTGTVGDSGSRTNTGTQGVSGSDTGTVSTQGTNTGTQNTERGIYGFDSVNASDADTETRTDNLANSETVTNNLAHGETRTDNLTETNTNTRTDNLAHAEERTKEYTITKGGNLGVTTSQQMLESEMLFRQKYTLMDSVVFPNIDKVMCLDIFGDSDLTLDDFNIVTDYILPVASSSVLGGVKIGNGITINSDGTISVNLDSYVTTESLSETLQSYVTTESLSETLQSYATKTEVTNGLATKQDNLVSGTNIKTINGESILGSGDITIKGGTVTISMNSNLGNQTGASSNISMEVIQ